MTRFIWLIAAMLISAFAQAAPVLAWSAESLTKAQELCKQDASKHVLVFYTQWRR